MAGRVASLVGQMSTGLAEAVVTVAREELARKVRETSRNRGPRVDVYVKEGGGLDPEERHPWCASFASWVVLEAAKRVKVCPAFRRGASILKLRDRNGAQLTDKPAVGAIWLRLDADGKGHCGIVVAVHPDGSFDEIGGNTGPGAEAAAKDREGDGVYLKTRKAAEATGGFLVVA